jgi:uncharacterized membrane-anchored protein
MNWTKASAVAEILSSVAILATLVYLVIEIQQTPRRPRRIRDKQCLLQTNNSLSSRSKALNYIFSGTSRN